jgi:tetratricopeptide (TPR) repeat protein
MRPGTSGVSACLRSVARLGAGRVGWALGGCMVASTALAQPLPSSLIDCAETHKEAETVFSRAERGEPDGDYARAAGMWAELAESGSAGVACPSPDEHWMNAAVAFQKAGDTERAVDAFRKLIERHPDSPLVSAALDRVALSLLHTFDFAGALEAYAALAARYPKEPAAVDALSNTVVLRMAFGDWAGADEAAATFQKNYRKNRPDEAARVAFAVAAQAVELAGTPKGPSRAQRDRSLERARNAIQGLSDAAIVVDVLALSARQAARDGRSEEARRFARGVIQAAAGAPSPSEPGDLQFRALGRMLTAVGEGHFLLATLDRKAPAPAPADAARLAAWLDGERAEMARLEASFLPILEIRPMPPPKWVVEAHGEIAVAWTRLHAAITMRADALEDRKPADAAAFRHAAATIAPRARAAADAYLAMGAKLQHGSSHLAEVEAWGARVFPERFVPFRELMPAPAWVAEGTGMPSSVLSHQPSAR